VSLRTTSQLRWDVVKKEQATITTSSDRIFQISSRNFILISIAPQKTLISLILSIKTFKIEIFPFFSFLYCPKQLRSLYEKPAGNFQDSKKEVIGAISFDKAFSLSLVYTLIVPCERGPGKD
jgi:hypothetical protein